MTNTTTTSRAAAQAMRDAAAALARRRPLHDGASGEPADEELAQAIEDLPLPDADTTDWKAETERLRGLLSREQQERHAMLGRMDAALAALAQAREVLRHVEWLPGDLRPDEPRWCMICMSYEPHHAPDCALNAALAAKGE